MGSCYGMLPGMAEAGTVTTTTLDKAYADKDPSDTVTAVTDAVTGKTTVTVTGGTTESPLTYEAVTGGTGNDQSLTFKGAVVKVTKAGLNAGWSANDIRGETLTITDSTISLNNTLPSTGNSTIVAALAISSVCFCNNSIPLTAPR